jgi:hypothetical protein
MSQENEFGILLNSMEHAFIMAVMSDLEEPQTFDEAWNNPDPEKQLKWRDAITEEMGRMV